MEIYSLYKNGQLDASAEVSADNDAFSVVGAYLPTAEALDDREPFHGMIDDLIVWDRALTSSEVSLLHEFESNLHEPYPNDEDGLVPFVVTEFHKAGFNGEYEFGGRILTEGSSPVIEAGVFLSKSIVGENLIWLPAQVNEQTLEFFVSTDDLEPGVRYYYRAYARNSAGENVGSLRKFVTREVVHLVLGGEICPISEGVGVLRIGSASSGCSGRPNGSIMPISVGFSSPRTRNADSGFGTESWVGFGLKKAYGPSFGETKFGIGFIFSGKRR